MKRGLVAVLCLLLLTAWIPWGAVAADTTPSAPAETMTLAALQAKYPHGAYWNHTDGGDEDYTWSPCTHHAGTCTYDGACGCNSYRGKSVQCMGFAYQLAALAYGDDPYTRRTADYDAAALDTLKAGDIVRYRYNGHSIFVTGVAGDTVTYADCNSDRSCGIRWNATITKDALRESFTYVKAAPYGLPAGVYVDAPAVATVGQTVAVTVTYDGGGQPIGGLVGTLTYDAAVVSYISCVGDDVEISPQDGGIRYVYCPSAAQAPTAVTIVFTFAADALGNGTFGVTTEEFVNDTDYASLGTPVGSATLAVVKPTLTVGYHGGGGTIDNVVVARTYRVLSSNGINMRQDAGTDKAKVTALPNGAVFTVAVEDTKEASGYIWGKTAYNGKTGWVVISDFVEQIGETLGGEWRLSDGVVCHVDGTPLTHTLSYGEPIETLCDPAEIGLYRDGHRFAGWADGDGVLWTQGMTPTPDTGEAVTLYAVWTPLLLGDTDGDGRLNNRDLAILQRYLNGWDVTVTAEADMDGDGAVNNRDLGLLQRKLNEWEEE